MVRRFALSLLLLLALSAGARAGDPPRPADLEKAFDSALSLSQRREVLRQAEELGPKQRLGLLARLMHAHGGDPEAQALLARALVGLGEERLVRNVTALLDDKDALSARRGILRVLADALPPHSLRASALGRRPLDDAAATILARAMVENPDDLRIEPATPAYGRLQDLLHELAARPVTLEWHGLGSRLAEVPALAEPARREVIRRARAVLGAPTVADLAGWSLPWLEALRLEGDPAGLSHVLALCPAQEAATLLAKMRGDRTPDLVPPLVEAFALCPHLSSRAYRIVAVLQDLTGAPVPADPEQWRSWLAGHRAALASTTYLPPTESLDAAVNGGIAFLLDRQRPDGSFVFGSAPADRTKSPGATALVLYALHKAGVPKGSKALERAAAYLLSSDPKADFYGIHDYNYAASLAVMAFESLDEKRWGDQLTDLKNRLVEGQQKLGGWTYRLPYGTEAARDSGIDLSNTQYAVLGLRAAAFARLPIPAATWSSLLKLVRGAEIGTTGEWRYAVPSEEPREGMAAVAAASMVIARNQLENGLTLDEVLADEQIVRALRSMARKYGRAERYDDLDLYTLYSIERVGSLLGVYAYDGVPWYATGTHMLCARQLPDGGWGTADEKVTWYKSWGRNVDTAYALLFFRRATTPVFSGGLDIPSNPSQPIRRVPPPTTEPLSVVPAHTGKEPPPAPPKPPDPYGRIARSRTGVVEKLRRLLPLVPTAGDRLFVWRAIVRVDPLDVEARLMAAQVLGDDGTWKVDPVLEAALPFGEPDGDVTQRVASLLGEEAQRLIGETTLTTYGEAGREAIAAYAKDLQRIAKGPADG